MYICEHTLVLKGLTSSSTIDFSCLEEEGDHDEQSKETICHILIFNGS